MSRKGKDRGKRGDGPADGGQADRTASRPHLSSEDHFLWEHTARSVTPLDRAKPRVHEALETLGRTQRAARPDLRHETRVIGHEPATPAKPHPVHRDAPRPASPPPIAEFDRRKARRIARGSLEIEARIDLHGMKQREAHGALRAFLLRCHARGLSTVLVITGKGSRPVAQTEDIYDFFGEHERGALKRNVPHWLAEPDLRTIVVSHGPAAIRHGGEGALYVQLRRKRI